MADKEMTTEEIMRREMIIMQTIGLIGFCARTGFAYNKDTVLSLKLTARMMEQGIDSGRIPTPSNIIEKELEFLIAEMERGS